MLETANDVMVDELRPLFRGTLFTPADGGYDEARMIYNGMIDKRPAVIARCANTADVIHAVRFARNQGMLTSIKSGGHNGPGLSLCDDGMVIDLSAMRGIRVDPKERTARVQGGCTWGDVDHATHAYGLATVSGIISTTGVGGLTLGGGHGYLTRKYGLTIDNLLEADVILSDGSQVTASPRENEDLFWAIRGGGGNFGVVTSFLFRLHPVGNIVGGPVFWPIEQAADVLSWYRDFIRQAPEDLSGFFGFHIVPPAPAFPEDLHMKKMCVIVWCYAGPLSEAERMYEPIRKIGSPALYGVQEMPYPALQSMFDELYPPGMQWYWKADFVKEIDDDAVRKHVSFGEKLPSVHSTMHLYPIDGAPHRVGRNDTPFSYRDANWSQVIVGVDPDRANNGQTIAWAKDYWEALHPHSAGGAYINFMMEEGQERIKATYRDNYERLARIKNRYDPDNFFCVNQNIQPVA